MSSRGRSFVFVVCLGSFLALTPQFGFTVDALLQAPQVPAAATAILKGVVTDKDGGLVPGATVVVTVVASGTELPAVVTNAQGQYEFSGLQPGNYVVHISLTSFKTVEAKLTLAGGATYTLLTKLEIGARTEIVNVIGAADLVRTDTATVSTTINSNFISTLPRSDRNALNFLVFAPGTTTAGAPAKTVSGLPSNTVNITIDGVSNSKLMQSGDGFHSIVGPRLDAVSEVQLHTAGEAYGRIERNRFRATADHPLSTFGADVDTASYSNVRRFLSTGQLPPPEAVRIEEFVNYFRFGYATSRDGAPISLTTEIGDCPWAPAHKLVLIGARATPPISREVVGRNIVLLLDVSGSMQPAERLPLIKTALGLFVDTLRPDDVLSIVTYASGSGVALYPTRARARDQIQSTIAALQAGGSTNGGEGLITAYELARRSFIRGGINRVILATDGDFNVGVTSQTDLLSLIERERQSGVFLSVLGVGSGNLKDATMEMLADKGNGNYAYLDSLHEARRVLVREADSTLETVAKDVKFQVEFNPAVVAAWKLVGYENRLLAARDFNDDRKDAGDMGSGHTVTVLYEVIPVGADNAAEHLDFERPAVDVLRYQSAPQPAPRPVMPTTGVQSEWLTVKVRYKQPDGDTSQLISLSTRGGGRVQHLPLAAAVADFGLILRDAPGNRERWIDLTRRLDRLSVDGPLREDVSGLRELVATASGLARLRER